MSFYCYPDNIKKLNLGPNVRTISENALHYCDFEEITVNSANPYFVVENNCLLTKDGTTLVRAFNIKDELVIPDTITKAYLSALNGCIELKKLSIPASLTEFDEKLITDSFILKQ